MLAEANLMTLEPYDIPGIRDLAEMCDISLSKEASSPEVQAKLFPVWGSERAFIDNAPLVAAALKLDGKVIPSQGALEALRATETLDRWPLRNVCDGSLPSRPVVIIDRGQVANWMERSARESERNRDIFDLKIATHYLVASDRPCDKDSEVDNRFVREYYGKHGRYPTEDELLPVIVESVTGQKRSVPRLATAPQRSRQILGILQLYPEIAAGSIYVPNVANATYDALQVRRVIRESFDSFDEYEEQFWFSQDGFPLATTPEQAADPYRYQRPLTVFSGLVRLINELCLLQGR